MTTDQIKQELMKKALNLVRQGDKSIYISWYMSLTKAERETLDSSLENLLFENMPELAHLPDIVSKALSELSPLIQALIQRKQS